MAAAIPSLRDYQYLVDNRDRIADFVSAEAVAGGQACLTKPVVTATIDFLLREWTVLQIGEIAEQEWGRIASRDYPEDLPFSVVVWREGGALRFGIDCTKQVAITFSGATKKVRLMHPFHESPRISAAISAVAKSVFESYPSYPGCAQLYATVEYQDKRGVDKVRGYFEFCEEGDLQNHINRLLEDGKRVEQKNLEAIFSDLLTCMEGVHAGGVTHNDLKLENIGLISNPEKNTFQAKIIDWDERRPSSFISNDRITGTVAYFSPEKFRAISQSGWTCISPAYTTLPGMAQDVWAMGIVFLVALCTRNPFLERATTKTPADYPNLAVYAATLKPGWVWELIPDEVPPYDTAFVKKLKQLLSRMLHPDPALRCTMQEASDLFHGRVSDVAAFLLDDAAPCSPAVSVIRMAESRATVLGSPPPFAICSPTAVVAEDDNEDDDDVDMVEAAAPYAASGAGGAGGRLEDV